MFCVCLYDFIEIFLLRFSFLSSLGEQKLTKADGERGAKSPHMNLARLGRKQSTATEDFDAHISYLSS